MVCIKKENNQTDESMQIKKIVNKTNNTLIEKNVKNR